ncbi:MAG: Na(+)-translocating NADH-quinone reductase subunit A [Bacteroidales bacterium]|jgi:Na+-transporting NADH:ubiquinone oxidoreductase subunit A|nr:Na(+)-translocating NADH-quinone reductase subunit A [Bacteroidales bacterium]MDD4213398.1 Na(+)-translocating NADH-quinone reductase subunit A [Bacteroidales bacterium]
MQVIKIKKGLDIPLKGKAMSMISGSFIPDTIAIKPADFVNVLPKLMVSPGEHVKAGSPLFYNKYDEQIIFTSPVSGEVMEPLRGEKRLIMEIPVKVDKEIEYEKFGTHHLASLDAEAIRSLLLKSGLWTYIRQRPYDIIPSITSIPRDIYISTFDTSPLAPDYNFILKDKMHYFQSGIDALAKLTTGKVNLGNDASITDNIFSKVKNVELIYFKGKHPAGNVGVHIHKTKPINKGETVWYLNPQDVAMIGKFFIEGIYDATRTMAVTGHEAKKPAYYTTIIGGNLSTIIEAQTSQNNIRCISGNVLTGSAINKDGYLGYYHHQLTLIPEGDYYEFIGWMMPGFKKFSHSRLFMSGIFKGKEYDFDTNFHGGERPFVMTGQYEKVFPFDIYPVYLLKAILTEDIDKMEELGIYEVSPEDFALCDFVCTSKTETQMIVRQGLDMIRKEMS